MLMKQSGDGQELLKFDPASSRLHCTAKVVPQCRPSRLYLDTSSQISLASNPSSDVVPSQSGRLPHKPSHREKERKNRKGKERKKIHRHRRVIPRCRIMYLYTNVPSQWNQTPGVWFHTPRYAHMPTCATSGQHAISTGSQSHGNNAQMGGNNFSSNSRILEAPVSSEAFPLCRHSTGSHSARALSLSVPRDAPPFANLLPDPAGNNSNPLLNATALFFSFLLKA